MDSIINDGLGLNHVLESDAGHDSINNFYSTINRLAQASVAFTEALRASPFMQGVMDFSAMQQESPEMKSLMKGAMAFDAMLREVQEAPEMKVLIEVSKNISNIKIDPNIFKVPPLR